MKLSPESKPQNLMHSRTFRLESLNEVYEQLKSIIEAYNKEFKGNVRIPSMESIATHKYTYALDSVFNIKIKIQPQKYELFISVPDDPNQSTQQTHDFLEGLQESLKGQEGVI